MEGGKGERKEGGWQEPEMVSPSCSNPNTQEAEAEGLPQIWGPLGVHSEFKAYLRFNNIKILCQKLGIVVYAWEAGGLPQRSGQSFYIVSSKPAKATIKGPTQKTK